MRLQDVNIWIETLLEFSMIYILHGIGDHWDYIGSVQIQNVTGIIDLT